MLRDQASRCGAAGEANGVRAGAGHDLLTRNRPSMDQIDRPLRQTCLKKALNQASRDHRGRRCRLPNNNIACCERSRQVLARDTNRIVPRSQDGDYSVRLAQRKDSLAGRRWQQAGLQLGNVVGCIAEELRCKIDLVNGFAQWLALLQRELWRQARLAGEDGVGYPVAQSSTFEDRKSTRLNSSHRTISYAVFCLKKKKKKQTKTKLSTKIQ